MIHSLLAHHKLTSIHGTDPTPRIRIEPIPMKNSGLDIAGEGKKEKKIQSDSVKNRKDFLYFWYDLFNYIYALLYFRMKNNRV